MSKVKISELFYSLQAEARFVGVPSVFLRTFGCNFSCRGFSMPRGELTNEPEEIAKDLDKYKTFEDLPLAKTGCDTYASWHPSFKHLSPVLTSEAIRQRIQELLPQKVFSDNKREYAHFVITGGEPLLGWQRSYIDLIEELKVLGLRNITFETNGTQELKEYLIEYLNNNSDLHVTFSLSPKLSVSGHNKKEACVPNALISYNKVHNSYLYTKYVVETEEDLKEVESFETHYRENDASIESVYLMPVGGLYNETQQLTDKQVAELALKHGYRYSPRMHLSLFGNSWGT